MKPQTPNTESLVSPALVFSARRRTGGRVRTLPAKSPAQSRQARQKPISGEPGEPGELDSRTDGPDKATSATSATCTKLAPPAPRQTRPRSLRKRNAFMVNAPPGVCGQCWRFGRSIPLSAVHCPKCGWKPPRTSYLTGEQRGVLRHEPERIHVESASDDDAQTATGRPPKHKESLWPQQQVPAGGEVRPVRMRQQKNEVDDPCRH